MTPDTSIQTAYDELHAKIVDVAQVSYMILEVKNNVCTKKGYRPITLEDVLRAWGPRTCCEVSVFNEVAMFQTTYQIPNGGLHWHLGHELAWHRDNAPETIRFLHSLLCV